MNQLRTSILTSVVMMCCSIAVSQEQHASATVQEHNISAATAQTASGLLYQSEAASEINLREREEQDDPSYTQYKAGYKCILDEQFEKARQLFSEMIKKYPKSKHLDKAEYWSAYSWKNSDRKKASSAFKAFIKKYPSSSYFDDAIAELTNLQGGEKNLGGSMGIAYPTGSYSLSAERYYLEAQEAKARSLFQSQYQVVQKYNMDQNAKELVQRYKSQVSAAAGLSYSTSAEVKKEDPKLRMKREALQALVRSNKDEKTFEVVKAMVFDSTQPESIRETALQALTQFNKKELTEIYLQFMKSDAPNKLKQRALYAMASSGKDNEKVFQMIKQVALDTKEDEEMRQAALHALQFVSDSAAVGLYTQIANQDADKKIRSSAVYKLGSMHRSDDPRIFEAIKEFALNQQAEPEVREAALYSLRQFEKKKVLDTFLKIAKTDPDIKIRVIAIRNLMGSSEDPQAASFLKEVILNKESDYQEKEAALYSIETTKEGGHEQLYAEILKSSSDERFREMALHLLVRANKDNPSKNLQILREIILDLSKPNRLREGALASLASLRNDAALSLLLEVAKSEKDERIKTAAIYQIANSSKNKAKSLETLISLFDSLDKKSSQVAPSLLYAIASIGTEQAVDFLAKVAKTHENMDLRQQAVAFLGNIGGEKARNVLLDILKEK
ncbi:MAG: HEAT repeat domain-containing protein [bacterium]